MTALQKTIVTATIAVLAGAGIYEGRQAAHLRGQVQTLRQQNAPLQNRIQALENERDEATNQLARFQVIKSKSAPEESELLRLRSEVTRLRSRQLNLAKDGNDPFTQSVLDLVSRAAELNQHLQERPNRKIPELQLLSENDWLTAAQTAKFGNDSDIRKSLQKLRSIAKGKLPIGSALYSYTSANNGDLPNDLSQLKPFFDQSRLGDLKLDDSTFSAIVNRYKLLQTGNVKNFSSGTWFVVEKAPVDSDYDSRAKFGIGTSVVISTGKGEAGDPDDPLY